MRRLLVGIGNYSASDDGIGLHVIERVLEKKLDQGFEVIDVADNGLNLLSYFDPSVKSMLWVDAVRMGLQPGETRWFRPEEAVTRKVLAGMTTHEGDMLRIFEMARQMNLPIPSIEILGIEPLSTEMGMELSPATAGRLDEYVSLVVNRMKASSPSP